MPTPHIVPIPILPFGMVNAFAVLAEGHTLLVDAGLPGSAGRFDAALRAHGRSLRDVDGIVITHAHVDHAGGAAELQEASGAPLIAHAAELPFLTGGEPMHFCSTGWFGSLFLMSGAPREPITPVDVDVVLEGDAALDLGRWGLDGRVRHAGGHTPGSLAVSLGGGDTLAGDLLASGLLLGGIALRGRPKRPPFEEDPGGVAEALEALVEEGGERFHLGHGGPVDAAAVRRHVKRLRRIAAEGR